MKNEAAENLVKARLDELSKLPYPEVQTLMQEHQTDEVKGGDGVEYQIDVRAFYDDKAQGTVRVTVSVFKPKEASPWWKFWKSVDSAVASDSFIMKSDGSFVE
jgi:hypothetical protein